MRALQVLTTCFFVTTLSVGSVVSPEVCEDCRGETRRSMQASEEATSLLQFRKEVSHRSAQNGKGYVPIFHINLDDPPKQRFREVAAYYKKEIIAQQAAIQQSINQRFDAETGAQWWSHSSIHQYPEYLGELQGIVETVNHSAVSLETLILSNLLYEMETPVQSSALLAADLNGVVTHGRNMDYSLPFTMPDGTQRNWADLTYEAHYHKGNKTLYVSTEWPVASGVHTAMRPDGWSIQHSARIGKNDWHENLAALKKGGVQSAFSIRHILETTPDFETAVKRINATKFVAPAYFIMAGAKPWEGAVLSVDRMGVRDSDTPDVQLLNKSDPKGGWYILQTNDDKGSVGTDSRQAVATATLVTLQQLWMNKGNMMQFMHTPPLFSGATTFSNVMIPKGASYDTALPSQPPFALVPSLEVVEAQGAALAEYNTFKSIHDSVQNVGNVVKSIFGR